MRKFLADLMEAADEAQQVPELCARIKAAREAQKHAWTAAHPDERGNPFTQETVAHRIGVTRGAYAAWEKDTEPRPKRLRQIAAALELEEDYFLPSEDAMMRAARIEAEAERLHVMGDRFEELLGMLQARLEALPPTGQDEAPAQAQGEQE